MDSVASPFKYGRPLDGVLRGLFGSMVKLGVGAAELTSTCRPGDVGAVDAGVWLLLVVADRGACESATRRSMASICLLVAPDCLRDWRCDASLLTSTALSSPWSALTSFSGAC